MTADKDLAARLAVLHDSFHGECADTFEIALTDAHRSGQLITRADADAMVAAERERCAAFCESNIVGHTPRGMIMGEWDKDVHGGTHAGLVYSAAIRAAQPAPAKGGE